MTDAELRDQAVAYLKQTTVSYPKWLATKYADRSATMWGKAFAALDQIGAVDPPPPPPPPPSPPSSVWPKGGLVHCQLGQPLSGDKTAYDLYIVSQGAISSLPAYGRMSYVSLISCYVNAPVTAAAARANLWVLKGADGSEVHNGGYPANVICDPANISYQEAWAAGVIKLCQDNNLLGVWIDDFTGKATSLCSPAPWKYPTDQAWQDANVAMVAHAVRAVRDAGFICNMNAGYVGDPNGDKLVPLWQRVTPYVSVLCREYWQQNGGDLAPHSGADWAGTQRLVRVCEDAGIGFMADCYGSGATDPKFTYFRASLLLETDGRSLFIADLHDHHDNDFASGPWAKNLGKPVGAKQAVGVGWQRQFEGGWVFVNPHPTQSQSFTSSVAGPISLGPVRGRIG